MYIFDNLIYFYYYIFLKREILSYMIYKFINVCFLVNLYLLKGWGKNI